VSEQVEIIIKYAGYIHHQLSHIEKTKSFEQKQIPAGFDYSNVPSLRLEARQKLAEFKPSTVGQASRISGVSPADISILLVWLRRSNLSDSRRSGHTVETEKKLPPTQLR
jgi:tRNA uridine 5-carboxymethylaminomethyl modification enzyme